ncbi:MAG: TRAP transporter small permease [Synergistales bacterium]|nr:TRAP transporter small permease [Synergistales bacterium]
MALRIWRNLEELVGSVMIAVMVTIAFVNVVTRYFIHMSLAWTEEIEVNLFVWLVLLGTAMAFKRGGHLAMSFVYNRFPRGLRLGCYLFFIGLTAVFFGVLAYLGYREVCDEVALCVTTESLAIPVYYYTIATPLLSILVIIRLIQSGVETIRNDEY